MRSSVLVEGTPAAVRVFQALGTPGVGGTGASTLTHTLYHLQQNNNPHGLQYIIPVVPSSAIH